MDKGKTSVAVGEEYFLDAADSVLVVFVVLRGSSRECGRDVLLSVFLMFLIFLVFLVLFIFLVLAAAVAADAAAISLTTVSTDKVK